MDTVAKQQLPGRPRALWYRCAGKCPSLLGYDKSNLVPFGYIHNGVLKVGYKQRYRPPQAFIYAVGVRTAYGFINGQTKVTENKVLNQFGYYAGAPQGYGQPPRNQFN